MHEKRKKKQLQHQLAQTVKYFSLHTNSALIIIIIISRSESEKGLSASFT